MLHCRRGEENAHTRTGSGDPPRAGPGLPCGMLPAISEGLRTALRRAAGSTVHGRTRQSDHTRAVCALSDARSVCRRRAGGRRALCALVRVFPRKSAGHRAVRAQARRRIRRPRAGHDGGAHFPARRRAQDGEPHPRRCVPQARRGRGHALHPALKPDGTRRRAQRPRQD